MSPPLRARTGAAALAFLGAALLGYHLPGPGSPPPLTVAGGPPIGLVLARGREVRLQVDPPWRLAAAGERLRGRRPVRLLLRAAPTGVLVLGLPSGPARTLTLPCRLEAPRAAAPPRRELIALWGPLEVHPEPGPGLRVEERLDLETYLQGVLAAEMGPAFPLEALKAQAVAARSFALALRRAGREIGRTSAHQAFQAVDPVPRRIARAVAATRGQILGRPERPLRAYYHSTCGGATRDAAPDFDPRSPIRGRRCTACRESPYYRWRRRYRAAELAAAAWAVLGHPLPLPLREVRPVDPDPSGRARRFLLRDARGARHTVPAAALRRALRRGLPFRRRLPSTRILRWRWDPARGVLILEGGGWGHGVGLCQYGAAGLARRGLSYRAILAYYYGAVSLQRAW